MPFFGHPNWKRENKFSLAVSGSKRCVPIRSDLLTSGILTSSCQFLHIYPGGITEEQDSRVLNKDASEFLFSGKYKDLLQKCQPTCPILRNLSILFLLYSNCKLFGDVVFSG